MRRLLIALVLVSNTALGETTNPLTALGSVGDEFMSLARPFLVTNGTVEDVVTAAEAMEDPYCDCDFQDGSDGTGEGTVLAEVPTTNQWRFSVRTALGGPQEKLQKHYTPASPNRAENNRRLNNLVAQDFSNYADRRAAIADMCAGLSESEIIDMGSLLAGRLGGIYDFGRANGGSSDYISPEEQWDGLRTGTAVGVCRDAALTVSHFLSSCGIPSDRIAIEGYSTAGGGHQVVSVVDSNGDRYTINWAELFQVDQSAISPTSPQARILNAGLFHTVYDAETGMVKSRQRTELAQALRSLTGGEVDPNKLPLINALEATNGTLAFALFNVETLRGDSAFGGAVSYNQTRDSYFGGTMETSYGLGIARNTVTTPTSPSDALKLQQDIIYMRMGGTYRLDTPVHQGENVTLGFRSFAGYELEAFYARNTVEDDTKGVYSMMMDLPVGSEFYANMGGDTEVYAGGSGTFGISPFADSSNTQRGGFYLQEYEVHGGLKFSQGRVSTAAESRYIIGHNYTNFINGATVAIGDNDEGGWNTNITGAYSIYERDGGFRTDYITTDVGGVYTIDKSGRGFEYGIGAAVPVNDDFANTRLNLTGTIRF